ncbi:hypothetical protein O975_01535 [Mycobacterium avium subsp. paratuberculosis 11-1786]|nr:hypothetical protein O975_01535 [Mycobacterium avium subsp. paratuberculosis 11-1786]
MPAQRRGDHRDRHPRNIQVGPLLRRHGGPLVKLVGQQPARAQHRPSTPTGNSRKTVRDNKSHDLLLPEARPTATRQPRDQQ